ncbi:hypothetical protein [Candidatus Parabeggiatoa sp. HSG14]|uniref:hypothetical protein n=1 Tax=Candidatus Parabeggiatoa sp. HSG14 TaxID=3055593 RepID=UPI0025A8E265|nr:hypothetical protein [Thiotrichales bacterium HSG14]
MEHQTYANETIFLDAITKTDSLKQDHKDIESICQAVHLGKRQFLDKLGWLDDYQQELQIYTQMIEIAHQAEALVKNLGLTTDCKKQFEQSLKSLELLPQTQDFKQKVFEVKVFARKNFNLELSISVEKVLKYQRVKPCLQPQM